MRRAAPGAGAARCPGGSLDFYALKCRMRACLCARSPGGAERCAADRAARRHRAPVARGPGPQAGGPGARSEEHTSELQSHSDLVCRLLLEKKKNETE